MALEVLKGITSTQDGVTILDMAELRTTNPDLFPDGGMQMDYKVFEETIRPYNFIYIRPDVNSISFTIQKGPIKEAGLNGCQVSDIIVLAKMIIEGLDKKFPCIENAYTIQRLSEAIEYQELRTKNRNDRDVEGTSKK